MIYNFFYYSYGTVVGIGVGITRDCSTLMVAQYFKRRREFVEIFIVSGSGLGIAVMSIVIKSTIGYVYIYRLIIITIAAIIQNVRIFVASIRIFQKIM